MEKNKKVIATDREPDIPRYILSELMDSHNSPSALVIHWSSRDLRALCPYCLKSHGHGPGEEPSTPQHRSADCGLGSYYLEYPPATHDRAAIGWEFDEVECCLFAVTPQGRLQDPRDQILPLRRLLPEHLHQEFSSGSDSTSVEDLAEDLDNAKISDDDEEASAKVQSDSPPDLEAWHKEYIATAEGYKNHLFFQLCKGDFQAVSTLLSGNRYDHSQTLVDYEGSSAAHYVVYSDTCKRIELLNLLSINGFNLDRPDYHGRTPLMEAALWAREDAVRFLVKHGVQAQSRDGNGMAAIEFSQASRRNENERTVRAGSVYRPLAEDDELRRIITSYLKSVEEPPQPSQPPGPVFDDLAGIFRRNSSGLLAFYRPVSLYELPSLHSTKAFAVLSRGPEYAPVSAMSGYTHGGWPNVLDNDFWTGKAQDICKLVGHPDTKSFASHVEKQLIAFFAVRHLLLEALTDSNEDRFPWIPPPPILHLTVNKLAPCDDCIEFISRFETTFHVQVNLCAVGE
ncbi:MAG: hypothetical protein M1828_001018 [Chrysothrix sp. TS-e1954]|nr:MAG: hypothetical protein M1828_001018 [Chrysothrix sp. TS-e1954]